MCAVSLCNCNDLVVFHRFSVPQVFSTLLRPLAGDTTGNRKTITNCRPRNIHQPLNLLATSHSTNSKEKWVQSEKPPRHCLETRILGVTNTRRIDLSLSPTRFSHLPPSLIPQKTLFRALFFSMPERFLNMCRSNPIHPSCVMAIRSPLPGPHWEAIPTPSAPRMTVSRTI